MTGGGCCADETALVAALEVTSKAAEVFSLSIFFADCIFSPSVSSNRSKHPRFGDAQFLCGSRWGQLVHMLAAKDAPAA